MAARFTRLILSNWRNFREVDVELGPRVFIVGANAAGKTNLLDAFRFLHDIAAEGGSLVAAVRDRRGLKHIRSLHAGTDSRVAVEVHLRVDDEDDVWSYRLELSGSESRKKALRIERELVRRGELELLDRPGPTDTDGLLLTQTHLEQISQSLHFRPLADALASIEHVHVVPQVARTPARAEEFSRREAPGSDFIDQLARLSEHQRQRALKRIGNLLQVAVPRFSELKVQRDDLGRPHLEAKFDHWRRRGGWQNEQEFSDGTLRLIGLLWAIDHGSAPLLLEEPELSLHGDVIRQLPRLFAKVAHRNGRQIFVSSHAEEIFSDSGIAPSEVILLEPTEHETKVVSGTEKPEILQAVAAKMPLGRLTTALTRPKNIEQLTLAFPGGRE